MPNITQMQPEIPFASDAPRRVTDTPVADTPYLIPSVVTGRIAKEQARKDLKQLSEITGIQYNI